MIRKLFIALLLTLTIPLFSQAHIVISPKSAITGTGSPGGANTQIQFNDSGAFGGSANLTWDGSIVGLTGDITQTGDYTCTGSGSFSVDLDVTANATVGGTLGVTGALTYSSLIDGAATTITATGAEINYLDIAALGTGVASKALVLNAGEDYTWPATGVLTYGVLKDPAGTSLTSTVAELNYLDIASLGVGVASKAVVLDSGDDYVWPATGILTYGVLKDPAATTITATGAEMNYLDITTLGTGAASKAVVLDGSGDYTYPATGTIVYPASATLTMDATSVFSLYGTAITSDGAEVNYLDITTLGTGAVSKAVVLDASGDYTYPATGSIVYPASATLTMDATSVFSLYGTAVTADGAELNYLDIAALGTGVASQAVVLDAGDDYTWPATGILTYGVLKDPAGTTLGATVAEMNMAADLSANFEDVTAANILTQAECGKTMTLNSGTEFQTDLPAPLAGCKFKFIVKAAPSGANYTIVTNASADIIVIEVAPMEIDTTVDGLYDDDADLLSFVSAESVQGDNVECVSDGTNWYCNGRSKTRAALTSGTTP